MRIARTNCKDMQCAPPAAKLQGHAVRAPPAADRRTVELGTRNLILRSRFGSLHNVRIQPFPNIKTDLLGCWTSRRPRPLLASR